jgi:cell division protein FtsB
MNNEDRAFLTSTLRNFNAAIKKLEDTSASLSNKVVALEKQNKYMKNETDKLTAKCKALEVKLVYVKEKLSGVESIAKAKSNK